MVESITGKGNEAAPPHPRTMGWIGASALAMGGSNQSLFLIGALLLTRGGAVVPLLILGLLLSWAAAPGWTELVLMWPDRVGGIAATCAEAFRPYSPVLANLTGVCYWWGWVPTCGLTAILSATAIKEWYLPMVPLPLLATGVVLLFTTLNLCGMRWVTRFAIPCATISAVLAFSTGLLPILTGHVNWHQALDFHLISPFPGFFGGLTSAMAGLYLIGFAAPAFEAATCYVGETINPARNVPRAVLSSALMATIFFALLPVVWLGVLGPVPLMGDLTQTLGPTFAPLLGNGARAAAIWFMIFNMFHGTLQPLAGASRTLSQLAEDGLLPRFFAVRSRTDAPWVATVITAGMAILFLLIGNHTWVIAAANLTYLMSICLPSVAVWLLRRDAPEMPCPFRAPRGMIALGLLAAGVWGIATVLGFEQFGVATVVAGIAMAYSGSALYALRRWHDLRPTGRTQFFRSLHLKLTGAILFVLILDGTGYLLAVSSTGAQQEARIAGLEDIFVAVALLAISVGLILPGMIAHDAERLSRGTRTDFSHAMQTPLQGNLDETYARVDVIPVMVQTNDEVCTITGSFNTMQAQVAQAAEALVDAREGLRQARHDLAVQVITDSLTGLPNRRLLHERMAEALSVAGQSRVAMALLMLDLDRFKEVNDTFGHQIGDQLLQQVGMRLRQAVDGAITVARLGGDEFAVFLPTTDRVGALQVASQLCAVIKEGFLVEGDLLQTEVSIGIALYPEHGTEPMTLFQHADVAMYTAKRGRQGCALYDASRDQNSHRRLALINDLHKAIASQELRLYYQPKVELWTGTVTSVEALLRWQHSTLGLIPPDQFIPLAEQTGLIVPMTFWVVETALEQCRRWLDAGLDLAVAVNLSMWNLRDASLPDTINKLLALYEVPPHLLCCEITESAVMTDAEHSIQVLNRLCALGVRIAIDDYGTGYASLSYLKHLSADELKIDQAFVRHLTTDVADQAIVRSTVNMVHSLGMQVVAEGVEDQATLELLETLRCDIAQGYYLSRPLPARDLERWLDERQAATTRLDERKEAVAH